jgi:putative hydrolase of the HAD superfamily
MKYQNCLFDLYGTLVDIRTDEDAPSLWKVMAEYYRERGASYRPGELRDAYSHEIRCAEGAASSTPDAHEAHPEIQIEYVFQRLFQARGGNASLEQAIQAGRQFRKLSTVYIRLYDGAVEMLQTLREQGCGVYLLSNAQGIFTRMELDQLGLTPLFDKIYLSSDYGVKKPDRRFFDLLLQTEGIAPDSAVMIGNDGACDIAGGRAAGLATLYVRSNISPQEPLPAADYVLEEMDLEWVTVILTGNAAAS